jgi:hypothetical protein
VRGLLRGLAAAFAGKDAHGGTLLAALSGARDAAVDDKDLTSTLVAYARAFHGEGHAAQADALLLGALAASALSHREPPEAAVALAVEHDSDVAWALRFLGDATRARRGEDVDPSRFEAGMKAALRDRCAVGSVDAVLGALGALRDRRAGKKLEARRALDALLDEADARGLVIPKLSYRYEEASGHRVFNFNVEVSYGSGLLDGANAMQVGLGARGDASPGGRMTASFEPVEGPSAAADAARWYVHVAAIAAAWHFLDGDDDHAMKAAGRAVEATVEGLRLGPRAVPVQKPGGFGADARAILAVDAELAARAGHPFLAGDLWTVVKSTLDEDTTDASVDELLAAPPLGLAGEENVESLLEHTRRMLRVVADRLPCTDAKIDSAPYEDGSCEGYARGLSLRIADALPALPHLRKGAELGAPRCAPLRAVDEFLTLGEQHNYDPDAFTRAVDALRGAGRLYDAAVLFTRQRLPSHCSPAIVASARELSRSPLLGPVLHTNLLGVAINCSVAAPDPGLAADFLALDDATRALADPTRNLRTLLFVTELAVRRGDYPLLEQLVERPGFVSRWLDVSPTTATVALVLDHASRTMSGRPLDLAETEGTYRLLCETLPSPERAAPCGAIRAMRAHASNDTSKVDREETARRALEELVESARRASPPGPP